MNTTTDTPDTTRLSERIERRFRAPVPRRRTYRRWGVLRWSTEYGRLSGVLLEVHEQNRTLAAQLADRDAEIARVEAERDRYKRALTIITLGTPDDTATPEQKESGLRVIAGIALYDAPSAADRDHAGESGE